MFKVIYSKEYEYLFLIRMDNNNLYVHDKIFTYYNKSNKKSWHQLKAILNSVKNKNKLFYLYSDFANTALRFDDTVISMELKSKSKRIAYLVSLMNDELPFLKNKKNVVRSVESYGIKPTKYIRRKLS